jgi:MoaA/NifB/PqqE/SkfB family radical SAM enzyme
MKSDISFNWDIHWACNYRCPYCWFNGKWEEIASRNVYPPYEKLIQAWKKMFDRYGSIQLAITGGEPFFYPRFDEFVKEISPLHQFMIITNLSVDIADFIKTVNRENVKINPSFHPLSADIDVFIERALLLKEAGLMQCITYLSWPPLVKQLPAYQERFEKAGLSLTAQSFFGEHCGLRYPDQYSQEEKSIISPQLGTRGGKPFQTGAFSPKGRLCDAGKRYGVIQPDGSVRRCGGSQSADAMVGNIFDENFKLRDEPAPCTSDTCPCNEWAFLLKEE